MKVWRDWTGVTGQVEPVSTDFIVVVELRLVMKFPFVSLSWYLSGTALPRFCVPEKLGDERVPAVVSGERKPMKVSKATASDWVPLLPLKLLSPEYVAVRVKLPGDVSAGVKVQLPLGAEPEHDAPCPSLTETVPEGVAGPEPAGGVTVTPQLTVIGCPTKVVPAALVMVVVVFALAMVMLRANCAVFCGVLESATWIVKLNTPAADDVPEIVPFVEFKVNPGGRLPDTTAQLYGAVPPIAWMVVLL